MAMIAKANSSFFATGACQASKFYEAHSPTVARVAAVASPILMQLLPLSAPLSVTLALAHCVNMSQTGSRTGYALSAMTIASLGVLAFNPAIAPTLFLIQSLSADLLSGKYQFKKGERFKSMHDFANAGCSALRLALQRHYSRPLDIAATVIRLSSDTYAAFLAAKACSEGKGKHLELAGSLTMMALGTSNLYKLHMTRNTPKFESGPTGVKVKVPRHLCMELDTGAWGALIQLINSGAKRALSSLAASLSPHQVDRGSTSTIS